MLPRKDNNALPLSRGGSSTRLNQGLSPGHMTSFPSTPTSYQASALNPIRSASRLSNNRVIDQEFEDQFNDLDIIKEISRFENSLAELSRKIGSFDGSDLDTTVNSLLTSNQEISHQIEKLEQHRQLGQKIELLENVRNELDQKSKEALKKLISYRAELKNLPSLPTKRDVTTEDKVSRLDVDEVLKYGMKLSKFTKAPPSSNGGLQIHPNNFIWPAEDSLRRGMLAMSSLKGDEIIRKELGLDENKPTEPSEQEEEDQEEQEHEEQEEQMEEKNKPERRSTRTRRKTEKTEEVAPKLDLDLFDPENEDDSD